MCEISLLYVLNLTSFLSSFIDPQSLHRSPMGVMTQEVQGMKQLKKKLSCYELPPTDICYDMGPKTNCEKAED